MSQLSKKNNQIRTRKTSHNNNSNKLTNFAFNAFLFIIFVTLAIYFFKSRYRSFRWLHKTFRGFIGDDDDWPISPFLFFIYFSSLPFFYIALAIFDRLRRRNYWRITTSTEPETRTTRFNRRRYTKKKIQNQTKGDRKSREVRLSTSPHRTRHHQQGDSPAPLLKPRPSYYIEQPARELRPIPT